MAGRQSRWQLRFVVVLLVMLGLTVAVPPALAQPPATRTSEMCGTEDDPSTTDDDPFTVTLPGTSLGFATSGIFQYTVAAGPTTTPSDSVTLPKGCRLYLFIVSGYGENTAFNLMPFYEVAEHVAKIGGYVHVSWWNNFNKEYMGGPLHLTNNTLRSTSGLFGDVVVATNPGGYDQTMQVPGVGLVNNFLDKPKAVPVEDTQFIRDARLVLKAVRTHNPAAKIIVIGHGMGAHAAAKLGSITISSTQITPIDLLALIDPVGNQDNPRDIGAEMLARGSLKIGPVDLSKLSSALFGDAMNWSRWRATHFFRGYREWDCVKGPFGLGCAILFIGGRYRAHCVGSGPYLNEFPSRFSGAPLFCPNVLPDIDPGTRLNFSTNVANLYHRWQREYFAPTDFFDDEHYVFRGSHSYSSSIASSNSQAPYPTCSSGADPNDEGRPCSAFDGHGELIGIRGTNALGQNKTYRGLAMQAWSTDPAVRRAKLREMATADASWAHRPENPDLCLVCDDIIEIINRITPPLPSPRPTTDTTAPETSATAVPGPRPSGWNAEDVTIDLQALDEDEGSGVKLLSHGRSGAETVPETTIEADSAQVIVTAEGVTTLRYFATDQVGNAEVPRELAVRLDKTGPDVSAETDVPPNAAGWNRTNVVVTFQAEDALSGVLGVSQQEVVETEGAGLQIVGGATDQAGNQGTITVTLNIDKTAPDVTATTNLAPSSYGWYNRNVVVTFSATDALSEIAFVSPETELSSEGVGQEVNGTATDNAGNVGSASLVLNVDKTVPQIAAATDVLPNSFGWHSTDVRVRFVADDELSGLATTPPEVLVSAEGDRQAITGAAEDRAGNSANATAIVSIDKTAPEITAAANTPPNSNGWYSGDVVVSFTASDALSGLAFSSPDVLVSSEGEAQEISGTATDKADHTARASVIVNIDKTAPAIARASRTPANGAGWNNTDVALTWNCTDALSGPVVGQVSQSLTAEGAEQSAVGMCADRAGHVSNDTQSGINIDKTSPTTQITTPANGASYLLNAIVHAGYGCADSLSGVTACVGPVVPGAAFDTATVGFKTFAVNAADTAGNHSAISHVYTVQYAFSGFSSPIMAMPTVNTANAGKTIPVKYSLNDASGAVISDLASFVSLVSAPVSCDTNVPTAAVEETDGAASTTIRFDSGQFIYNWKTQAAWQGTCRVLQLELNDGTRHVVAFQFK